MKNKYLFYFILFCFVLCGFIFFEKYKKKPMGAVDYVSLGNQMGVKGDHVGASNVFKSSMKVDPFYIPAYLGLGIAYGNLGRNKEAVEVFKEGIKLGTFHKLVPQMEMGIATIAYDKMNNDKIAVKYIKKALQTYTDQGDHVGVAIAANKLKQISPKP
jgi:tetratricopeptide (TPR) repeat protein